MKGFATMAYVCLAGVTGFALFHIAFKVEQLETQLSELNKDILLEQNAVHVLKAEWSFLSRPERIDELRRKMLPDLHTLRTTQIGDLESLPSRSDQLNHPSSGPATGTRIPTAPYRPISAQPVSAQPVSAKLPE